MCICRHIYGLNVASFAKDRLSPSLTYQSMLLTSDKELKSPPGVPVRWGSSIISSTQEEDWGPWRLRECLEGHHGSQEQVAVGTACDPQGSWACVAGHCPRVGRAAWRLLRSCWWKWKGKGLPTGLTGAPGMALSEMCNMAEVRGKAENCSWGVAWQKKNSPCIFAAF